MSRVSVHQTANCSLAQVYYSMNQTWIQHLLIQDQDQDQVFDVQDQDRDSRLTRPIMEVHDWDALRQTKRLKKSWQAENSAYR